MSEPIAILDETQHFVVVDKPPGIAVHVEDERAGLLVVLAKQLECDKLYPVHRLDKETSGLLLVAKTQTAASELSQQFQLQQVKKTYLAIAAGKPKKKMGWVKGDMVKARDGSWKLTRTMEKPALTWFDSAGLGGDRLRLYLVKPETGKTHQIRVALKSQGVPILGDSRYGGIEADRMYLHALDLAFDFQQQHYRYRRLPQQGEHFTGDGLKNHRLLLNQ